MIFKTLGFIFWDILPSLPPPLGRLAGDIREYVLLGPEQIYQYNILWQKFRATKVVLGFELCQSFLNPVWCYLCQYNLSNFYRLPNSSMCRYLYPDFFFLFFEMDLFKYLFWVDWLPGWATHTHSLYSEHLPPTERFSMNNLKPFTVFNQGGEDHTQDLVFTLRSRMYNCSSVCHYFLLLAMDEKKK